MERNRLEHNDSVERPRIVCIVGPTACHKSEVALKLAQRLGGEIVSADSVQVYVGMDIGSAKASPEERALVVHHMIDCVPIDTPAFSVSEYRTMASEAIYGVTARKNTPVVVGGSGLYVNSLTFPLGFAVPRDEGARQSALTEYEADPAAAFMRLFRVDPETAARLHENDKKRVVRALEVYDCSGRPLSSFGSDFRNEAGERPPFSPFLIGLNMDRTLLYERINLRVDRMMQQGLLEEAKRIYDMRYDQDLPALRSIGYRQLFAYFDGSASLEEAVEQIKQDTRRFAKRQLTWFRRDTRICWHDVTQYRDIEEALLNDLTDQARAFMKGTNE